MWDLGIQVEEVFPYPRGILSVFWVLVVPAFSALVTFLCSGGKQRKALSNRSVLLRYLVTKCA